MCVQRSSPERVGHRRLERLRLARGHHRARSRRRARGRALHQPVAQVPEHRVEQRGGYVEHLGGSPRAQRQRERRQLRRARRGRLRRRLLDAGARRCAPRRRRRGDERGALPRLPQARRARRADRRGVARGPCLGEGAALLALERARARRARAAHACSPRSSGYGTAFAPPEREASLVHAVARGAGAGDRRARSRDAGVAPGDVDLVVSGVSGLRAFDEAELAGDRATCSATDASRRRRPSSCSARRSAPAARWGWLAALACVRRRAAPARSVAAELAPHGAQRVLVSAMGFYGNASARRHCVGYYGNASTLVMRALARGAGTMDAATTSEHPR